MIKTTILAATLIFAQFSFGQTKLISFKSHSGSMTNFGLALINPKMDLTNHNLGAVPSPIDRTAVLDSVIFVSDSQAVMVTSEYCSPNAWHHRWDDDTTKLPATTQWRAGADTVINHPLFSHQHSLDSIKDQLAKQYYFKNSVETAVFVGYDNGASEPMMDENEDGILDNEEESSPIVTSPSSPTGGIGAGLILISLLLASLMIGLMSWMMSKRVNKSLISQH